jgi:hypothetical protein
MNCRSVELPLTPSTKLSWLGFSDMGSVIVYEPSGRVISYPICDMMNHAVGASDNFFIISVSESDQKIRTTLCRGTNYPHTNPRPIVREVDYALPLCYMETEKSKLEETLVRATSFSMEASEKTVVESGLKLSLNIKREIKHSQESFKFHFTFFYSHFTQLKLLQSMTSGKMGQVQKYRHVMFVHGECSARY